MMAEVREIRSKKLNMSQARVINTDDRMVVAMEYATFCPLCSKRKRKSFLVRPDSVLRHMKQIHKYTDDMATTGTRKHMALCKERGSRAYFEAVSRIHLMS